jgi:hypothetical protein
MPALRSSPAAAHGRAEVPIDGYEELTARQAIEHLGELSPAELRSLRDYERRHANRNSVLDEIERALGR